MEHKTSNAKVRSKSINLSKISQKAMIFGPVHELVVSLVNMGKERNIRPPS